jgi:hypothetical protein
MHLRNVCAPDFRHPQAADRRQDMQAKERLVAFKRPRLALGGDVGPHEFGCDIAEDGHGTGRAALGNGIGAGHDSAEQPLGLVPSLRWR